MSKDYDEHGRAANAGYQRRLDDLRLASKAIGETADERLAWFTRFVAEDPKTWQSSTRETNGNCILALTGWAFLPNVSGRPLPPPLSDSQVIEVHGLVSRVLKDLVRNPAGHTVFIPCDGIEVGLMRLTAVGEKPSSWARAYRFRSPGAVLHVLKDLILQAGEHLIACQQCGLPIMAFRKRLYCPPRPGVDCAQLFRNDPENRKKGKARKGR